MTKLFHSAIVTLFHAIHQLDSKLL